MTAAHPLPPEQVMAYLDGAVTADQTRDIQAHLAVCGACQQLAADLREGSSRMREWQIEEPPVSLAAPQARNRTNGRQSAWRLLGSSAWRGVASRPLVAATAVVVLVVAVVALQPARKAPSVAASVMERAGLAGRNPARAGVGIESAGRARDKHAPRCCVRRHGAAHRPHGHAAPDCDGFRSHQTGRRSNPEGCRRFRRRDHCFRQAGCSTLTSRHPARSKPAVRQRSCRAPCAGSRHRGLSGCRGRDGDGRGSGRQARKCEGH